MILSFRLVSGHIRSLLQLKDMEKQGSSVGKVFDLYAIQNPQKVAFYFKDEKWTFGQVFFSYVLVIPTLTDHFFSSN
jgi:hypothetical protein